MNILPETAVFTEIKRLLLNASLEVTPKSVATFGDFAPFLGPKTKLFITHLPNTAFDETVSTALTLASQGMRSVLHIAARSIKSEQELSQGLEKLFSQTKDSDFLLIAGGGSEQTGPFTSSMDVFQNISQTDLFSNLQDHETHVFFAGHPEGSPDISNDDILKALDQKNIFAETHKNIGFHLSTQFCFEFEPIKKWLDLLSTRQNKIPIHLGIPGIASLKTLYNHAKACGVGNSIRFITKQMPNLSLLHGQNPNKLIYDVAVHNLYKPNLQVAALHLYPFGGIAKNLEWRKQILENELALDAKEGFRVKA